MNNHQQIQTLLAQYCFVTDTGAADDIAALFWEDCTVRFGENTNVGIEKARAGFARWIEKMRDPIVGLRHILHTPMIKIDGNRATAKAYYDADGHSRNKGKLIQLRGVYIDTLEKRGGEWKFLEKEVQIWRSVLDHAGAS